MSKIYQIIIIFVLILAILLNINWLHSADLGLISGLFYILIFSFLLGKTFWPDYQSSSQLILGGFNLMANYSLIGAIIYYFYKLDQLTISLLFIIISLIIIYLSYKTQPISNLKIKLPQIKPYNLILIITYLILTAVNFYLLWQAQTVNTINSPWQIINSVFFIIYFLASLNLILLLLFNKNFISSILLGLHFFLTTGIALLVYKLGYGFDPFIHQATEQAIYQNGFILPKPFYYLGQYSIIIFLAHLLQTSIDWLDKLLVPISLSLFLPYFIQFSLNKNFNWPKSRCRLLALSFLFLPFGLFIATNPQALANLFTIIILFLSFLYLKNKQISFYLLGFLTLTTILIHPISGIPILIYLIIIWFLNNQNKFKKIILPIFVIAATLALPAALILNSFLSIYKVKINLQMINFFKLPDIFAQQFDFFLDIAYLYKNSIYILFIIIAAITLVYLIKQKKARLFMASILTFIILIINAYLLKLIKVSHIIDYEQDYFSERVWQLAFYFLLPIVIYGLYLFIKISFKHALIYKFFIILLLAAALIASLYISYPRYDDYDNSNFVNLSQLDFAAVNYIEANANGQDYIVLSNQMTAAAALKTFGFNRYYNGYYFYPIPTGGQLYQYFLQMIDNTNQKIMLQAMDLTDVKQAYFVLPGYWSQSKIIAEKAAKDAEIVTKINDHIYIYKYSK
ncbi:MAG: hypothetical protein GF365_05295 [Candidatus Buchananbacteria bacterium]|nr:hypothetical protein [Candidatus Buchananbacteria bacterium]